MSTRRADLDEAKTLDSKLSSLEDTENPTKDTVTMTQMSSKNNSEPTPTSSRKSTKSSKSKKKKKKKKPVKKDTKSTTTKEKRRQAKRDLLAGKIADKPKTSIGLTKIWMSAFSRLGKTSTRDIIREPWKLPMAAQNLASRLIQTKYRGHLARKMVQLSGWEGPRIVKIKKRKPNWAKAPKFSEQYSRWMGSYAVEGIEGFAAAKIQATYWKWRFRRRFIWQRYTMYHIAAMEIQYVYRASKRFEAEKSRKKYKDKEIKAALLVQNKWRCHANRRIYKYYRDLIRFRNAGDPAEMLRSINGSEANLIDPASKIYVRFRLGGYSFPPTIYYKVYTSSPICDVGAFAPKNYSATGPTADSASQLHNSVSRRSTNQSVSQTALANAPLSSTIRVGKTYFTAQLTEDSRSETVVGLDSDWYERWENNGWRSVTAKSLQDHKDDSVTKRSAAKRIPYNRNKLRRKEDLIRIRKEKKRKWLRRLYFEGMAKERKTGNNNEETKKTKLNSPILSNVGNSFTLRNQPKENNVDIDFDSPEWDERIAEELLEWTEELDYDSYLESWISIGTSTTSDYRAKLRNSENLDDFAILEPENEIK
eukprot:g18.t1